MIPSSRPRTIDYDALGDLHYLGKYTREIPVSVTRMMENAHDWEHLPFVHPGSFASIRLIEDGDWGWRCATTLPGAPDDEEQMLELLVDKEKAYWSTSVLSGPGAGVRIDTKAKALEARKIAIDVRFYLPSQPANEAWNAAILERLQQQYAGLYDEDETLMTARQDALDSRKAGCGSTPNSVDLGPEADLDRSAIHPVTLDRGPFVVRFHDGQWIAHASVCPHMLGPLDSAPIDPDGYVTCPWHAYRFALDGGAEIEGRCGSLPKPPVISRSDGHLFIRA